MRAATPCSARGPPARPPIARRARIAREDRRGVWRTDIVTVSDTLEAALTGAPRLPLSVRDRLEGRELL